MGIWTSRSIESQSEGEELCVLERNDNKQSRTLTGSPESADLGVASLQPLH